MEKSKLFAVFGNPILHSKSPQLFNSVFYELKLNAFYTRIIPQSVSDLVQIIKTLPLAGANITAPFKEEIVPLLDEITADAKQIGAVNTILNSNGKLIGFNTDHSGVTESLKTYGINLQNCKCLILGAGGAARGAAYGLTKQNADVYITNRTLKKAQNICTDLNCNSIDWNNFDLKHNFDIVISTLLPEVIPPFLHKIKFNYFFDASYKNSASTEIVKKSDAKIIPGKLWLIYQAVEAYKIFFGTNPNIALMEHGFEESLKKEKLKVFSPPFGDIENIMKSKFDLLISTTETEPQKLKNIIDEEIGKAFGS